MQSRVRHALRFALPTLAAVYVLGAGWNAVDVFMLGDADPSLGAARTFTFDERQWRVIAVVLGAVVFFWKLSDIVKSPPSWPYAVMFSVWVAVATVATAVAMMERQAWLAASIVTVAVVVWLTARKRVASRVAAGRVRLSREKELR